MLASLASRDTHEDTIVSQRAMATNHTSIQTHGLKQQPSRKVLGGLNGRHGLRRSRHQNSWNHLGSVATLCHPFVMRRAPTCWRSRTASAGQEALILVVVRGAPRAEFLLESGCQVACRIRRRCQELVEPIQVSDHFRRGTTLLKAVRELRLRLSAIFESAVLRSGAVPVGPG